jgi:hypothetical protein
MSTLAGKSASSAPVSQGVVFHGGFVSLSRQPPFNRIGRRRENFWSNSDFQEISRSQKGNENGRF